MKKYDKEYIEHANKQIRKILGDKREGDRPMRENREPEWKGSSTKGGRTVKQIKKDRKKKKMNKHNRH